MKVVICLLALLCLAASAPSDYVQQREKAMKLIREKQYAPAIELLTELARTTDNDAQQADALREAALAAELDGKPDQAMQLAEGIRLEADRQAAQMTLLYRRREFEQVVQKFAEIDLEGWPDRLKGDALMMRGVSAFRCRRAELAVADLQRAPQHLQPDSNNLSFAYLMLGTTYRHLVKDPQKAIEAYRRTYGTASSSTQAVAAINVAEVRAAQGDRAAALEGLQADYQQLKASGKLKENDQKRLEQTIEQMKSGQ